MIVQGKSLTISVQCCAESDHYDVLRGMCVLRHGIKSSQVGFPPSSIHRITGLVNELWRIRKGPIRVDSSATNCNAKESSMAAKTKVETT